MALLAVYLQVMPVMGTQKPLALESISLLLAQLLRKGWVLLKKCVPSLNIQTVPNELFSIIFPQGKLTLWGMRALRCFWKGWFIILLGFSKNPSNPSTPPPSTPDLFCSHRSCPSCVYVHLLGSMPSSFGLGVGDAPLSVFRGKQKVEVWRTAVLSDVL